MGLMKTLPRKSAFRPGICAASRTRVLVSFLLATLGSGAVSLNAATIFWDGTGTSWSATSSWSTASGATTPDPGAVPGSADLVQFNISPENSAQTVDLDAARSVLGSVFSSAGTVLIQSGVGSNTLTLGTSGITVNSGAGAVTLTSNVALGGAQSWTNGSTSLLSVSGDISGANGITVNSTGSGAITLSGNNSYTGATTLNRGTLRVTTNATALGAGTLSLGGGNLQLANSSGTNLSFNRNTTVTASSTITSDVIAAGAGNTYTLGTLAIGAQQLNVQKGSNVTSGTAGVTFGTTTLSVSGTTFDVGSDANLTLNTLTGPAFNFWKQGSGTLTFASAASTARTTGATYLTEGTVVLGGTVGTSDGLGTSGATLVLTGGTLDLATDTSVLGHATTVMGSTTILSNKSTASSAGIIHTLGGLTLLGPSTLTVGVGDKVSGGTPTVAFGAATMNANTTFSVDAGAKLTLNSTLANGGFTPTFTGAGDATVTGVISGGGGLSKSGSGTLTLSAANTYTGVSNIGGGTVTLGNVAGLGATATAVLNMTGGTLNLGSVGSTLLALSGNSSSAISSTGLATLTVNPVGNSTSNFAGNIGGGGGTLGVTVNGNGALTLSGANSYTGATTLTAGQLNLNSATAPGSSTLTVTTGTLDNTSGGAITLSNNNNVTLNGNFTYGGSENLSFGSGTLTTGASRTLTLMGNGGKALTFGTWNNNFATSTTTVKAMPGSNSTLNIGTFVSTSTATAATITGNGNINITGGIQPAIPAAASVVYSNAGTLTLSGNSTYTGATTFNGGTVILDATGGPATLAATAPTFAGGNFIFKGNSTGTGQTLGNLTLNSGASMIQVVGGASGTTLTLGSITNTSNGGMLNINLDSTSGAAGVTTTTNATNNIIGARGSITVTTGGTTEFATKSGSNIVQYTGQTNFVGSGSTSTVNYKGADNLIVTASESMNSLRLTTTTTGQSLNLGSSTLTLTSGGLLFVGADDYSITGGTLKSATATSSDLIIHNFGAGGLNISSVIANGTGTSVVSLDGPGTTTLSGVNTYTGVTTVGGGAVLSVGANSGLGAVATGATLILNNATLKATNTFSLDNSGANIRAITLGVGGGTFDVTGSNTLTALGVISGSGSLTKTGSGKLLLSTGVSTYSGGFTNIQNGTLQLAGSAGSIAAGNIVTLGSGSNSGILVLGDASNAKSQTIAGLTTLGTGTANAVVGGNTANSTLTYTGTVAVPTTFNGTLGGAGTNENNLALTVTAGSLTLGGNNTYAGPTSLSGGVLNLNSTTAIGSGNLIITGTTNVIDNTSGSAKTMANNNNVTTTAGFVFGGSNDLSFGAGTLSPSGTTTIAVNGNSTLSFGGLVNNIAAGTALTINVNGSTGTLNLGGYNMQANTGAVITNTIAGSGNVNITGPITPGSFNASNALTYSGTGVLTLSGANTYTGVTTMNNAGGMLKFGPGGSLNGGAGNLTLTAGAIDLGGQSVSLGTFSGTAGLVTSSSPGGNLTSTAVAVTNAANWSGNLSANLTMASGAASSALSGSFYNTGDLTMNNASNNAFSLTGAIVANTGNLTFNANSIGAMTISAASLNPNGTITNSGSGTGTTTISGVIGRNVTAINQTGSSPLSITSTLYVNSAGTTVTQSGTGLLTLGTATINGTGNLTIVDSSSSGAVTFSAVPSFAGNLTFQSNSTGVITASGAINNSGTVTNSGTGSATTVISGIIGPATAGVIQNSATSALSLTNTNTFNSGLTIKAGTVSGTNANSFGANANVITLGDSSGGNANATLSGALAGTFANPIVVASTNTGVATITDTLASTFSGAVTLNNHGLNLSPAGSNLSMSGGFTGTGDLTLNSTGAGVITLSTTSVNHNGTVTNSGAGGATNLISAGVGSNVTGITQNSTTSALTVSGALTVNGTATTLTNTAGTALLTLSGGTTGTGNLVLNNDSATANGITVSAIAPNHIGTIVNSGSGSGSTLISPAIGANVTAVIQDSATSMLRLTAANTFSGAINIRSGTLQVGTTTSVGTGIVTIGNTGTSGTLDLNGLTETISGLATAGTAANQTIGNSSTATNAAVNLTGATTSNFGGTIQDVLGSGNKTTALTVNNVAASLTLSGANTYTGATTVTAGALNLQHNSALGTGTGATTSGVNVVSGGVLQLTGGISTTTAVPLTLNGAGIAANPRGALQNINGNNTFSGLITLAGASTIASDADTLNLTNPGTITGPTFALTLTGAGNGVLSSVIGTTSGSVTKNGSGTWTFNGASSHTYTGATAVNNGTLQLDFANLATPTNLITSTSALTLGGGILSLKGKSSGTTSQTLGAVSMTANTGSGITLDPNGGAGTTLTLGAITRNTQSTLNIDRSAGGTVAASPGVTNGILTTAYATVKDSTGTGFATVSGGTLVRYTGASALATNSNSTTTNFNHVAAGSIFAMTNASRSVNSLSIDTSSNSGTLDLGGAANVLTLTSRGLLMTGVNDFTIQNGVVGSAAELIVHQMGSGTLTISSPVSSGAGSLTKNGSGKLVLGSANTYTGGTSINGGVLQINNANSLQNSTVTINSVNGLTFGSGLGTANLGGLSGSRDASLTDTTSGVVNLVVGSNNASTTYSGALSGAGSSVTKVGTGILTLSGASSYSGTTSILAGAVTLGGNAPSGAAGTLGNATSAILLGNTSGSANVTLQDNTAFTIGRDIIAQSGNTGTVTIGTTSGVAGTTTYSGSITLGSAGVAKAVTLSSSTAHGTLFSGVIQDPAGLSGPAGLLTLAAGSGNIYLSGTNTFTGGVAISSGNIRLGNVQGYGLGNLTINGGLLLQFVGGTVTGLTGQTWAGNFGFNGSTGTVNMGTSPVTLTGNRTILVDSGTTTIGGVISGAGYSLRINSGATGSTLNLNGANTFDGGMTISQLGALQVTVNAGNASALGTGQVRLTNSSNSRLALTANTTVDSLTSGVNFLTTIVGGSGGTNGTYPLIFTGGGGSGATGTATISGGAITAVSITDPGTNYTSAPAITLSGGGGTGTVTSLFTSSTVNLNPGTARVLTIAGTNASPANYVGIISGAGGSIVKNGAGTQILSGANTYTGTTSINAGVLSLAGATALNGGIGATGGNSPLTLNGGVLGLQFGDFNRNLGATASTVQFTDHGGFAAYGADRIVNFNNDSHGVTWAAGNFVPNNKNLLLSADGADATLDFQNPIDFAGAVRTVQVDNGSAADDAKLSGVLSGTGNSGLTKTGLGTLRLTAVNTYTGTTTVSAGSLALSPTGSIATSSLIRIQPGATFDASAVSGGFHLASGQTLQNKGTFTGSMVVDSGATFAPGNSPGISTQNGDLTLNTGSTFQWELVADSTAGAGTNYDQTVFTSGGLTIQSAVTADLIFTFAGSSVDFTSAFWDSDQSWLVFTGAGSLTASSPFFGPITTTLDSAGNNFSITGGSFAFTSTGNDVFLNYYIIPEPASGVLLGFGVAFSLLLRRRRPQ